MTKDFANRGDSAKPAKKKPRAATSRRRATPTRGNRKSLTFHGPSFSSGAIFGAVIVLLAAYLPEWMEAAPNDPILDAAESSKKPRVTLNFQTSLRTAK